MGALGRALDVETDWDSLGKLEVKIPLLYEAMKPPNYHFEIELTESRLKCLKKI